MIDWGELRLAPFPLKRKGEKTMTLSEFLAALNNPQAVVTVLDSETGNPELIKLYASGYEQLLAALLAIEVDKVSIVNAAAVTVLLKAA